MKLLAMRSTAAVYQEGILRVLVPVNRGEIIGLDNTCKSVVELQQFFGFSPGRSPLGKFEYCDIGLQQYSALTGQDLKGLIDQLNNYIDIAEAIRKTDDFTKKSKNYIAAYPEVIAKLLSQSKNVFGIRLSVQIIHGFLKMPEGSILFSGGENLGNKLRSEFKDLPKVMSPRDQFIAQMRGFSYKGEGALQDYASRMSEVAKELFGCDAVFDTTEEELRDILFLNSDEEIEHDLFVDGLLGSTPEFFDILSVSPFYGGKLRNAFSLEDSYAILTQLFLAELNMYCVIKDISTEDFGCLLEAEIPSDSGHNLRDELAGVVKDCFSKSAKVEEAIAKWLNKHFDAFKMKRKLLDDEISSIVNRFHAKVKQVRDTDHFDEFMVCEPDYEPMAEGRAHVFGNTICFDLMDIAKQIDLSNVHQYTDQLRILAEKGEEALLPTKLISNEIKTSLDIDPRKYDADFMLGICEKYDYQDIFHLRYKTI